MNSNLPQRKNIRLKNYNYSQAGYYFITICVENRIKLLWSDTEAPCDEANMLTTGNNGNVGATNDRPPNGKGNVEATNGRPPLSEIGNFIETALKNIETIYSNVFLDEYVIMPNHIHFIMVIGNSNNSVQPLDTPALPRIIQQFKGFITKNCGRNNFSWQKSYYEHIIRNEKELKEIREYIRHNPLKWCDDEYYI